MLDWLRGRERRIELRDESLLRLFFADALPDDQALGLLEARREGYREMLAYLSPWTTAPGPIRPTSISSTAGRSTTANGESNGASSNSTGCAQPPRRAPRPDLAVDARARLAAVHRRGGGAGARVLRRMGDLWAHGGDPASSLFSLLLASWLLRRRKDATLVAVGMLFVAIQAAVGLVSHDATVYLAQPVVLSGLWSLAYFGSVAIRRPLIGIFATAWYPFPDWFRASRPYRHEFGMSRSCGAATACCEPRFGSGCCSTRACRALSSSQC